MPTLICIMILMLCYNALTARQEVLDIGSQVCPYTNFCHTEAWKIMPNDTNDEPCCFPCFCDEECWEFDNCCPDIDLIATTRPQVVPCIDSLLRSKLTSSVYYQGEFYRVIDTCPVSENSWNFEPKCNKQNITSLEDFIWVSDKTGKIYKNIHCAKCHGIKEPITWQIQTKYCFDIMMAKFDNFMEALLLSESCSIKNTPPADLRRFTDKYACYDPRVVKYNTCNESGLMTSYDPAIEIACEQSTWPYLLDTRTIAKNMFCLLCNQELPEVRFDLCFIYRGGRDAAGFTFFIDYTSLQAAATEEVHSCGLDEMFDKFLGICRKLWCPFGTTPVYGRCIQLVSKLNRFVVSVQLYLDIIWNQTSLFTFYENATILSVIHEKFIELADLNSKCVICKKIIDVPENSGSDLRLVLVVTFEFNPDCDYGLALAKVADMRDKKIEIHFNRTAVLTLLVQSDKQPSTVYTWERIQSVPFYKSYFPCPVDFRLSFDDITCPRIELNYAEMELFSQAQNKEKDMFTSFFIGSGTEQNMTRVSVCLDTYISAMSLNHAPLFYSKLSVQMLLVQFFVLAAIKLYSNK